MVKKSNFFVANWKMNPESVDEAKKVFGFYRQLAKNIKNTNIIICPPAVYLGALTKFDFPKNIFWGAQNVATEPKGSFTGEISASMLRSIGVEFVIVGHSERRLVGESNEVIRKKLMMAFEANLNPILCIGETVRDKEGQYLTFLRSQIQECLNGLPKKNLLDLLIAYEPVWAIGKSYREAMTPTDIHEMTLFIKKVSTELFGADIANSFKILYGAAVEAENAPEIMRIGNTRGFLVGHASLIKDQFETILKVLDMRR